MDKSESKRFKVLCPITRKDETTYWARAGAAFVNRDGSITILLDLLPTNGKLQLRDWDEPDRRVGDRANLGLSATAPPSSYQASADQSQLPF
jgi:hypothetical protein